MTQVTIMTGEERRRKWSREDRERILAAAFAPGAVVTKVAGQLDVASSLIYTWRRQMSCPVSNKPASFSPAILIEREPDPMPTPPSSEAPGASAPSVPSTAITIEFSAGVRVTIGPTRPWSRRRCWLCNDPGPNGGQNLDRYRPH